MNASSDASLLVALEHERVRLVQPGNAVVVEDLRVLELGLVDEAGVSVPRYAWKCGRFQSHLAHGSNGLGCRSSSPPRKGLHSSACPSRTASRSRTSPTSTAATPHFVPDLMERAIAEINDAAARHRRLLGRPDDLRLQGGVRAGEALPRPDRPASRSSSSPGTTTRATSATCTSRTCSASATRCCARAGVTVVAVDSTEPDLDHGQIGRGRYGWIEEQFAAEPADLRIFVLHHHLLPVPGTGRERNVVYDAGDCIECLQRAGVNLVLSGHKHVPYAWRLENLFVVNTGTVSSLRLRGTTRPCYNVVEVNGTHVADLAPVPVPRAGADHPVRPRRRSSTRSTRRGSSSEVTRRRDEGSRADRRRALARGRAGRARGAAVRLGRRDPASAAPRSCAAATTTACRSSTASAAPRSSSTSPTSRCSGPRDRLPLGLAARSPPGCRYVGADFRFDPPHSRAVRPAVDRRDRHRQAGGEDRRRRPPRAAARAGPRRRRRRDGPGRAAPSRESSSSPPTVADLVAALARAAGTPPRTTSRPLRSRGVPTVGCRRCGRRPRGAGRSSRTCSRARGSRPSGDPDVVVFDGSGAAIPPIASTGACSSSGRHDVDADFNPYRRADLRPRRRGRGVEVDGALSTRRRLLLAAAAADAQLDGPRRRVHGRPGADVDAPRRRRRARLAQPRRPRRSARRARTPRRRHVPGRDQGAPRSTSSPRHALARGVERRPRRERRRRARPRRALLALAPDRRVA